MKSRYYLKAITKIPTSDFQHFTLIPPESIPPAVDLRPLCSPVESQGTLGSCTGHALASAIEFLENKQHGKFVDVSRLFAYYNERVLEHSVDKDAGALLSDGIKVLAEYGICDEALWPYDITKFKQKPSEEAYQNALTRRIKSYTAVQDLDQARHVMASGYPVIFGFQVFDSFESDTIARTGIVRLPQEYESCLGGHAVLMVGYDDEAEHIIVRNSWGPTWGQHGYFMLPYSYANQYASDMWAITK